ncbi:MAG: YfhO family protein, partial [Bacteroidales bacterium]|nr:YfhO family protein [Bacteroidales bacterium]
IVAEVAMPLLGFLAVKALMDGSVPKEKLRKSLFISAGVTAGLCLLFALLGKSLYSFAGPNDAYYASQLPASVMEAIVADRAALLTGDAWRSFAFIAAAAVLLWLFLEKKVPRAAMIAILGVLVLADMWPVDKRYFNDSHFQLPRNTQSAFAEQPWETTILQDEDPNFRVMNLTTNTFNDARTSYRLKSVGGYHAAKLRRYQDLIDEHLSKYHMSVIDMLNTKYLIVPDQESGQALVQRNPGAMGNAWFVERLMVVDGARAESNALDQIDLTTTAVLDREFEAFAANPQPGIAPDAEVHLTAFTPKQLDYDYRSATPGTIVFSEIYYPYGWKATIDGQKAEHFRVNYLLRAINVPEGSHHITFIFDPDSVRKGDRIATICVVLMYLLILSAAGWGLYRHFKTRKDAAATH